jgi:hypothetical protein
MTTLYPFRHLRISRLLIALAAVVLAGATARAEETQNNLLTALSSTTISGYVDSSAHWNIGAANSIPEPATGPLFFAGAAVVILFHTAQGRKRLSSSSSKTLHQ